MQHLLDWKTFHSCFFHSRDSFFGIFSVIYGIMLIMVGIIIYTFDLFGPYAKLQDASVASDVFNVYCSMFGIVIISWLMFDIQKYLTWLRDSHINGDEEGSFSGLKLIESENGELIISMPLVTSKTKKLPQYYCFTTGRHAGSFFLKVS